MSARPLRFCMLTTFYPPASFGGDGIQVGRLSRELADRGHQVTVLHSPEAYRSLGGRAPELAERHSDSIHVIPIDARAGMLSPLATYLTGRPLLTHGQLERALAERFDVIHFHNPSLLGGPAVLRMGEAIKLYTAHEQWLVCPTHVLFKYKQRVCERPQCWRCAALHWRPPQLWRSTGTLERAVAELDALIAPSAATAGTHRRLAPLVRIERLDNFVPTPPPSVDARAAERPYFLFAGRLEAIKGAEVAIEAFRRQPAADLVIAGAGDKERSLRAAAAELPNVHFAGWLGEAELDAAYRGARAVIVPTLGHESFPLVPLEALARGTPAIVRGFGALAELAEASEAALAFSTDAELDAAISSLLEDEALRQGLSERAVAAHRARWTPEAHLRGYFGLIAGLARDRGDEELARAAEAARVSEPEGAPAAAPRA